jgi:tryptophan 7-halogenase
MSATNDEKRPADPKARLLWQLVGGLKVRFFHERSFRLYKGVIAPNRYLLTIRKDDVGENPRGTIRELWRRLGMPDEFALFANRYLATAQFLHFGYEGAESSCLYKVYLEMGVDPATAAASAPILLHLAFKWDPAESTRATLSRYYWYPGSTVDDMVGRLSKIYPHIDQEEPLAIARGILLASERRRIHGSLRYLEVTEDNNQRKSFDINLYDAKIKMEDCSVFFTRMCQHFAIPNERFQALFEHVGSKAIGHLAGGTHRAGEDFFNVYYGVEERQGLGENVIA